MSSLERSGQIRSISLWPALFTGGIVLGFGLLSLLQPERVGSLALIMAGAGVTLFIVQVYARRRGGLSLLHPVVYIAVSYYLPQFVLIPLIRWLDWNSGTFIPGLGDKALFYFNLSEVVGIGSLICLGVGFSLPVGRRIARHLPSLDGWNWPPRLLGKASFAMYVLIGIPTILFQVVVGRFTYGGESNVGIDAISYFLSFIRYSGLFLVWFCYWRIGRRTSLLAPMIVTGVEIAMALLSGSRGQLLVNALVIMMSYLTGTRKRVSLRKVAKVFAPALAITLMAGVLVGTIFRLNKVSQSGLDTRTSLSQAVRFSSSSVRQVGGTSLRNLLLSFRDFMLTRIDGLENLGIILAYADQLKPLEESIGMSNNIPRELFWSLIPRFLYRDKPVVGDIANKYAINYIGSGPYQFSAMTAMGDLYRNFGLFGVAMGMVIIGILMRIMYAWLKPMGGPVAAAALLYVIWLLFHLGLESNYSALIVNLPRTGAVMMVVLLFLKVLLSIMVLFQRRNYHSSL